MTEKDLELIEKIKRKKPTNISELRISPVDRSQAREIVNKMLNKSEWDRIVKNTIESMKKNKPMIKRLDAYKILVRNQDYLMNFLGYQNYLLEHSTISIRDRELLILRVAWLSGSDYMWFQHKNAGFGMAGMSLDEIERIKIGPDAEEWEDGDIILLRAVDELYNEAFITDTTWKALAERYNTKQLIDMLGLVSLYFGIAMILKTLGVQAEASHSSIYKNK
ncbi:MAG: carboxymuconolactone decarboxylase family protein [Promethearchaeota archaeon]